MIRTGWVLSRLSSAFMIVDGLLKLLPPDAAFLEELHRLGEAESTLVPLGLLQFACGALYAIPRTAIGQRCLARRIRNGVWPVRVRRALTKWEASENPARRPTSAVVTRSKSGD